MKIARVLKWFAIGLLVLVILLAVLALVVASRFGHLLAPFCPM